MIKLKIELADSPSMHQRGLMFRRHLDEDSGMLFRFANPQQLNFWGVNTYIPLDIAFISPENKIVNICDIKPFCKNVVSSKNDCLMAIETNLNFFTKNGIEIGDKIKVEDDRGFPVLIFEKSGRK